MIIRQDSGNCMQILTRLLREGYTSPHIDEKNEIFEEIADLFNIEIINQPKDNQ